MLTATKFTANTTLIAAVDFITKIFNYLFILFLARSISISDFGLYNFIVYFFYFFWVVSDFGLQYFTTRVIAEDNLSILNKSAATRFYMAIFAFALCLITTLILPVPAQTKLLIFLYSLALFSIAIIETIMPIFRGTENFIYERLVLLFKSMVFIATGAILIYITKSLLFLVLAYVFAESLGAVIAVSLLKNIRLGLKLQWLKFQNFSFSLLKQALPFIAGIGLLIFYYKIDGIMLKLIKGNYDLAIYSSAFRIYEALLFIPAAIHATLLPRLIKTDEENFPAAADKIVKITLFVATVISILVIGYSSFIPALYGREGYQALISPLRIIFLVAPLAFVNYIYIAIAYVEKKESKVILPLALTMVLNVGANLYFIPKYSYIAAAWTTNVSEIFLWLLISSFVLSRSAKNAYLLVKFYGAFLISIALYYIIGYPVFLPLGVLLVNFALLYIFKAFTADDFSVLKKVFLEIYNLARGTKRKGLIEN